jgi:hypothetical protein
VIARDTASASPAQTRSAQFSSGCGIVFLSLGIDGRRGREK